MPAWKVRGRFVAAVLELEGDEGESGEGLAGYCAWRLSEHVPLGKISVIDGKIVLLLDAEQEEGGLGKAQGALEVFLRTYGGVMGVSEVFADIADISFAYKQACLAIWYGCKRRISLAEQCEAEENAAGTYAFAPYLASLVFDVERPRRAADRLLREAERGGPHRRVRSAAQHQRRGAALPLSDLRAPCRAGGRGPARASQHADVPHREDAGTLRH